MNEDDQSFLREIIRNCEWNWARTMPTIPHEYVVRGKCWMNDNEFNRVVELQRAFGIHERWGRYNFPYLHVDGFKYWTMGAPVLETTIINRQKIFNEYDAIGDVYDTLFTNEDYTNENKQVSEMIARLGGGKVLDIGCGTGLLLEMFQIDVDLYTGVDPSSKMLFQLKQKFPMYSQCVINKAFEECDFKMHFDTIVSLFGSPSYLMKQYIPKIQGMCDRYFLMFYKPDYDPVTYSMTGVQMHHFPYTPKEVRKMLPTCELFEFGNYMISSNIKL